jgi:subtilisin family serine protease
LNIPNCDPKACILPGIPFPPGCDAGAGPGGPGTPPATRPAVEPAPAEVDPPQEDPDLAKAWGILKVGAKDSWATFRGDKNFIVADIDTGTDYNHPDLAGNIWRNPNPVNGDVVGWDFIHNDGLPYDDQGHGTHTAGSIGAVGGNGIAISGVAQKVSIMTLKFLSAQGQGSTADAIKSIDYAVANGARVLSNSWGGKSNPLNPDAQKENKALYDSIERARTAGVLFVAAAGNDGKNNDKPNEASYPAAFDNDNILSVAATDENDKLAFFSNTGVVSTDLAAPGVNVYSTQPQARYQKASGTSMACPHVAGAAALLWARHPSWDYKKVKQVLMDTAQKQPSLQGKMVTGARLDILEALRSTE